MPRSAFGLMFVFLGWLAFASCKSACPGVMVDGKCEKTCQDSACASGTFCVDNACRPKCNGNADCGLQQRCSELVSDNGVRGSFCVGPSSRAVVGAKVGTPCTSNGDCAESSGVHCIGGTCTFTCEAHDDCVSCNAEGRCTSIGSCTGSATDSAGQTVRTCEDDGFPREAGQFGSPCPNGPESDDCDKANGFVCIGSAGDVDAYCTKEFCSGDADCPSGLFCSTRLAKETPCGSDCGTPKKPNAPGCIASADIGPGRPFRCGPASLTKQMCLRRKFCAPCENDADCLGVRNQLCAKDPSGEKICTVLCDDNINSCPWGAAATCRATDDAIGKPTCSHRFGSCHGSGKSCEPCVDQRDCPTGVCLSESFTNELFCVDLDVTCSCPAGTTGICAGGGCPTTPPPSNSMMSCYGGSQLAGSSLENRCVGAATGAGCWPSH